MKSNSKKKLKQNSSKNQDIIQLILNDHKPLKKLLKVLKDEDADIDEKKEAFEHFAPLLIAHAKPEAEVLYEFMKDEDELRTEGFEGEVEHTLVEQTLEEIKQESDEDVWSAKAKVVAEMLEHHIEEEEETMLPDFKKNSEKEDRMQLGQKYLSAKSEYEGNDYVQRRESNQPFARH